MYRGLCEPLVFIVLVMLGHCGSMFIYFLYLIVSGIHSTEISQQVPNVIHIIGNSCSKTEMSHQVPNVIHIIGNSCSKTGAGEI